jgi:hypothetical protein
MHHALNALLVTHPEFDVFVPRGSRGISDIPPRRPLFCNKKYHPLNVDGRGMIENVEGFEFCMTVPKNEQNR